MRASNLPMRAALLFAAGAALATVAVLGTLWVTGAFASQQEKVAQKGTDMMPFDLDATTHVFEKTSKGGVQKVVADDPDDAENVLAIREHLREEAAAFSKGEFSDPAFIHGEDMPGLAELEVGADRVEVSYEDLSDGAQIALESEDLDLVKAIHDWFDSQLSDHGDDAKESNSNGQSTDATEHEEHH